MAGQDHGNGHDPNVAHHFESADQQFQSAKLGMWLFLATEILFFGGLLVAYTVYRTNHPEVFVFGAHFLDKGLGALNTVVLIFSSFTIAWAVRAAQLKQIKLLKWLLIATMSCAFVFLGVKYVEYSAKWQHGLLWASKYDHHTDNHGEVHDDAAHEQKASTTEPVAAEEAHPVDASFKEAATEEAPTADPDRSTIPPAADGPAGLAAAEEPLPDDAIPIEPANAKVFFSVYFLMTGLHGIHVIGGILAMLWLLAALRRGVFDGGHFTRVDMVALYWHVVDIIWIYLFLLLYLID